MHALSQLWLPILAAAVFVYIASSLIHMVFRWHNSDYRKLGNEDEVQAALRKGSPTPGQYVFPHCTDMKAMRDPGACFVTSSISLTEATSKDATPASARVSMTHGEGLAFTA